MQSVSSRIWTRVVVSISYDDNHYTTGTSLIQVWLKTTELGFFVILSFSSAFWLVSFYQSSIDEKVTLGATPNLSSLYLSSVFKGFFVAIVCFCIDWVRYIFVGWACYFLNFFS